MENTFSHKWLALYCNSYGDTGLPTYLVVADTVDQHGIRGAYITLKSDGSFFAKDRGTGYFNWNWIKKIEIL